MTQPGFNPGPPTFQVDALANGTSRRPLLRASISVLQHLQLSKQTRPCDTLACCWALKQPIKQQKHCKGRKGFSKTEPTLKCVSSLVKYKESLLFVGCLSSQQHVSLSQGRICSDNFTCCHTEIEVADQTFYLTQSQHSDTGPTSPSADPVTPGAWQGSHWSANFQVTSMTRPGKNPVASGIRTPDLPLSRRV